MMNPIKRIGIGIRDVVKDLFFRIPHFDETTAAIRPLFHSEEAKKLIAEAQGGPNLALLTLRGAIDFNLFNELLIGKSLQARGCRCLGLLCDSYLAACDSRTILTVDPEAMCRDCWRRGKVGYETFDIPFVRLSELVSAKQVGEIRAQVAMLSYPDLFDFVADGVPLGQIARTSTYRFFLRGHLGAEHESKAREFLVSAMIQLEAIKKFHANFTPEIAFSSHGIYVSWGVYAQLLPKLGVRTNYYDASYRQGTIRLTNKLDVFKFFIHEPEERWLNIDLTPMRQKRLEAYLSSRFTGKDDWPLYRWQPKRPKSIDYAWNLLQLDRDKPKIGLFTNIAWDAVIHYDSDAFADMFEWVYHTIEQFARRPELELLIGVHPAEIRLEDKTQERLVDALRIRFGELPPNVKLVLPEYNIPNYNIARLCQAAIVYGTNMGLELALQGMPVVVAGTPLYHGKGFTLDVANLAQYNEILTRIEKLPPPDDRAMLRARKYAYHLFFETSLPFKLINWGPNFEIKGLAFDQLTDLLPGKDAALDLICSSLLNGLPIRVGDEFQDK